MGPQQEKKIFDIRKDEDIAALTKVVGFKYKPATLTDRAPVLIAITSKLAHIPLAHGAYAAEKIKKGSQFEYTGTELPTSKVTDKTYAYGLTGKSSMIDGLHEGNELRAVNHSALFYNMIPVLTADGSAIMYQAIRDIEPGEQLLVPYGDDYDYPENLIILHPSDSYHSVEELIKKYYQPKPHHLDIKIEGGVIRGDYYLTDAAARIINKPRDFSSYVYEYSAEELDLPLLEMNGDECDHMHQQPCMTPLMLMAAQGKDNVVELLINAGVEVNRVDNQNNSALSYSFAHNQRRCAEKILKAIEHKIDSCKTDEEEDQQKQFMILQNRFDNNILHIAILNNSDPNAVRKILNLYKKLATDPFMYVNKEGLCPLLTAISIGNIELINEITDFIKENSYIHYHITQKNTDVISNECTNYATAFAKLSISNIKLVLEKLANTTNIFFNDKFVLNLFNQWVSVEVNNSSTQFPLRFQVIADVFKKLGVDEKAISVLAEKYLAPTVNAKITSRLGKKVTSIATSAEASLVSKVDLTPAVMPDEVIPVAPKATRLLVAAAEKSRAAVKRKIDISAPMPTIVITSIAAATPADDTTERAQKRLTRHSGVELVAPFAEPITRKRKAEEPAQLTVVITSASLAPAIDDAPLQIQKRLATASLVTPSLAIPTPNADLVVRKTKTHTKAKLLHNPHAVWVYVEGTNNEMLKLESYPEGVYTTWKAHHRALSNAIERIANKFKENALSIVMSKFKFYLIVNPTALTAKLQLEEFFNYYNYKKPTTTITLNIAVMAKIQSNLVKQRNGTFKRSTASEHSDQSMLSKAARKASTVFMADEFKLPDEKRVAEKRKAEEAPALASELQPVQTISGEHPIGLEPAAGVAFTPIVAAMDDVSITEIKTPVKKRKGAKNTPKKIINNLKEVHNPAAEWVNVKNYPNLLKLAYFPQGLYDNEKLLYRSIFSAVKHICSFYAEKGLFLQYIKGEIFLYANPQVSDVQKQLSHFFKHHNYRLPTRDFIIPSEQSIKIQTLMPCLISDAAQKAIAKSKATKSKVDPSAASLSFFVPAGPAGIPAVTPQPQSNSRYIL